MSNPLNKSEKMTQLLGFSVFRQKLSFMLYIVKVIVNLF